MRTIKTVMCLGLVLISLFTATSIIQAQSIGSFSSVNITASPAYPEPHTEVTVKLDAYSINTTSATINWFINGVKNNSYKNSRKISFTVGDLGKSIEVTTQIIPLKGAPVTVSRTITPGRVDLVIEADTYVPLHYKGRALPSNGSMIRAIALPATSADLNTLIYTWEVDGAVLYGGPAIGKNVVSFKASLKESAIVTVEVATKNGTPLSRKTVSVDIVSPELYFYEDNPLRGLSRNILKNPHTLVGDEIIVRAEPYFMSRNIFNGNSHTQWKINNNTIENPSNDPQMITLRPDGGAGNFKVEFNIRNLNNILQRVGSDFVVRF